LTKKDRENLDFFTKIAWQYLDFLVDFNNRDNNKDNFDFDKNNDLFCGRLKNLIKNDNNTDLFSLNNSIN
jgi:hypothetical protein